MWVGGSVISTTVGTIGADWSPRLGDYLVHNSRGDNYFICASEYQTNYLEIGTWTADVAFGICCDVAAFSTLAIFAQFIFSVRAGHYRTHVLL